MRIDVVGAGPAGVTAALLLQGAGHDVTVWEQHEHAGGRTRSVHLGPQHWLDTGAGWLTTGYPVTMGLLRDHGLEHLLTPLTLRGGGDLLLDGMRYPAPNSVRRIATTPLLSPRDRVRFLAWMARLLVTQRPDLSVDRRFDRVAAVDHLRGMGVNAMERVVRPTFEGPFFARLEQMNATLVRSWMRMLSVADFFQVDGGMDRPWRELAAGLTVTYGTAVTAVSAHQDGAQLTLHDGRRVSTDAVVLAIPAPQATRVLGTRAPSVLSSFSYVPHVRAYLARPSRAARPREGVHIFPNDVVATVEHGSGGEQAWGRVPEGWEWTLVCAPSASSERLLLRSDDDLLDELCDTAAELTGHPVLWRDHDVVQLVRWDHAVPVVDHGYYGRLAQLPQRPPVVFAGDWTSQPCVEGAVRSGYLAAELLTGGIEVPSKARLGA